MNWVPAPSHTQTKIKRSRLVVGITEMLPCRLLAQRLTAYDNFFVPYYLCLLFAYKSTYSDPSIVFVDGLTRMAYFKFYSKV
jgi:hypothetical protein